MSRETVPREKAGKHMERTIETDMGVMCMVFGVVMGIGTCFIELEEVHPVIGLGVHLGLVVGCLGVTGLGTLLYRDGRG